MLKVDLRQLQQRRRIQIDEMVQPADAIWHDSDVQLAEPLRVELEAQYAGQDVVVRGRLSGRVELPCRRCLEPVSRPVDEEVAWLFRRGLSRVEAEDAEMYSLPERGDELSLEEPIREQLLLAAPQFAICREECRGLCPHCGANWNETQCDCEPVEVDERWAALRNLRTD
jgi:uncharacterized protein